MLQVSPKELYDFMSGKGYKYFFHANTVRTSCTLIHQGGLLSRGEIETRKLPMTSQTSDNLDKLFDVWNDIFLDIIDLHGYFPRQNLYGPVCFKISSEFLLDEYLPNICITKDNPIYWKQGMPDTEKYYLSVSEYVSEFDENMRNGTIQTKMFTIRNTAQCIPFKEYLAEIILDNPTVKVEGVDLFSAAQKALANSLNETGININILKLRSCNNCYCKTNYSNDFSDTELERLFKP